ncbi:hypothetical protein [Aerosakkonema funiforme]|uniref:hypothetical protein n=1 Tax=Aerosakkonema funiforme TaxID=1246630 RepID=UPI0035B75213
MAKDQTIINSFYEKPQGDGAWINGGYFVVEPAAIDYIADDATVWEQEPMQKLAHHQQLSAYRHDGFWQPMDTLRDKNYLENPNQAIIIYLRSVKLQYVIICHTAKKRQSFKILGTRL